jgi:hypothetical protein
MTLGSVSADNAFTGLTNINLEPQTLNFFRKLSLVFQNSCAFGLNVFKLTPINSPPKTTQDEKDQNHRQGNEQIQDFHHDSKCLATVSPGLFFDKRRALSTTTKELVAIPKPASQAGNHPSTASGTHAAL